MQGLSSHPEFGKLVYERKPDLLACGAWITLGVASFVFGLLAYVGVIKGDGSGLTFALMGSIGVFLVLSSALPLRCVTRYYERGVTDQGILFFRSLDYSDVTGVSLVVHEPMGPVGHTFTLTFERRSTKLLFLIEGKWKKHYAAFLEQFRDEFNARLQSEAAENPQL